MCLCEAAHIPVILATQVLETLAKSGLPTRAEITDAAIGYRAECVMLNKGKHVLEAEDYYHFFYLAKRNTILRSVGFSEI